MKTTPNTSLAVPGALAMDLQRHTPCNIAPPEISIISARVPKWLTESGKSCILRFWVLLSAFAK